MGSNYCNNIRICTDAAKFQLAVNPVCCIPVAAIAVGTGGTVGAVIIIALQFGVLVPQELLAVTHTLPEEPPKVTVMDVLP